jgi:hypothetical protein
MTGKNNGGFIQTIPKYVEQLNFALDKKEVCLSLFTFVMVGERR